MSIVPLKKVSLFGLSTDSKKITLALQETGAMHIIKQNENDDIHYSKDTEHENLRAIEYLVNSKNKLHMLQEDDTFIAEETVDEISALIDLGIELKEQKEILEKKIEEGSPWGNFELIPSDEINGNKFYFYIMPTLKVNKIPKGITYSEVKVQKTKSYIVVIAKETPLDMPVKNIKLPKKSLKEMKKEIEIIDESLDGIMTRRIALTKYRYLLANSLNDLNNEAKRLEAEYLSKSDGEIFYVKGYVGKHNVGEIRKIAKKYNLAILVEKILNKDKAPTLLKNPEKIAGGEEIVKFYSVPGYHSADPSNILFFSFALFFAMIMSDFGYAVLMGIILMLLNAKLKVNPMGKRIRTMGWFIVFISMIWGALVGSYFGAMPIGDNIFASFAETFKKLDMENINQMLKVSIYVGIGHICLANLFRAWHERNTTYALSKIGWALITLSGIIYIPYIMMSEIVSDGAFNISKTLLITGLGLVFFFSSTSNNIFKRILGGILGLTKISGAFGDILSYLRIFALGLASASLGITFNNLSIQVIDAMPTFGYIIAFIILLTGHTINFALGIMSGIVHGLRLNVIEFFNWSISDEGYPFNAFSKTEIKKWIHL